MQLGDSSEDVLSGFAWAGGGLDWKKTLSIVSTQEGGALLFVQRRGVKPLLHSSSQGAVGARGGIGQGKAHSTSCSATRMRV
jgi:hypothetical protein